MNITLGKEFERRISEKVADGLYTSASEVIRDGLRMLFEKDVAEHKHEQLAAGESSNNSVMDIFEQALESQSTSKNTNI